ncbi:hypothetical protein D516_1101 [Rhodobacter sp. AKP1]|nr:hypothetical protein D516_1101 [Rhodobacter sp. AKP1]
MMGTCAICLPQLRSVAMVNGAALTTPRFCSGRKLQLAHLSRQ